MTDEHRTFIDAMGSMDMGEIRRAVLKAFGLSDGQAVSIARQWEKERLKKEARKERDKLRKRAQRAKAKKKVHNPAGDRQRFRELAGDLALSDEEIKERRWHHHG